MALGVCLLPIKIKKWELKLKKYQKFLDQKAGKC